MPNLDNEAVERAARLLNTRLASGDLFGVTRDIITSYLASIEAKGMVVPSEPTPEGYKHIIHASDGITTVVVDDEPEHPFDPLEEGDRVETIPLFRAASRNTDTTEGGNV